ncbi:MAG: hypothetical protein IPL26_06045 [Leptospiraceae bacterium]|nr:hypothetical protein [Leptospiraceae bacterium]
MYFKILILLLSYFLVNCSGETKTKYKDTYTLKVIFDNAIKPQANPLSACQNTATTMQVCADISFATTFTEAAFISLLSSNAYSTYTGYCNSLILGQYKDLSDSLKECFFTCDTNYWQTRKNLNSCNNSFAIMVVESLNNSTVISCKRNCSTSTNNNP